VTRLWNWIVHFSSYIEGAVLNATESFWIFAWVFGLAFTDAIFPVVPSESIVIATATAGAQTGVPWLPGIWIAAATGAWCGDQMTYLIGSRIKLREFRMFRNPRGQRTLDWADHSLKHRGTAFIIAARFIPFGRVAVNLTAGALRYPRRRFMVVDAIAVAIWASYGIALGAIVGTAIPNLLVSVLIGVVGGVAMGWAIDKILARFGVAVPDDAVTDRAPAGGLDGEPAAPDHGTVAGADTDS